MAKKNCSCMQKELSDRAKVKEFIRFRKSIRFQDKAFQEMNDLQVQDLENFLKRKK